MEAKRKEVDLDLTRFGGPLMVHRGGVKHGQVPKAIHAGVSAADGRAAPVGPLVQRARRAVRLHELVDPHVGQAGGPGSRSWRWRPHDGGARRAEPATT